MDLKAKFELDLGSPVTQLRAAPVQINADGEECLLVAYSNSINIDPWYKYMHMPTDTVKLALVTLDGTIVWRRDLGAGVIPGIWFFPFFPFDLDGDGIDEIWIVNNPHPERPFNSFEYVLERIDSLTGATTGQWRWPHGDMPAYNPMSHAYRLFIFGGYAHGKPVLVTAQGTYGEMHLQGWSTEVTQLWRHDIPIDSPGARGSHMTAVVDWNNDGVDEVFWGERCIELAGGRELFCADCDTYRGHSDIVQPVYNWDDRTWGLYTIREKDEKVPPRVCYYNAKGQRIWGHLDEGHIHVGWVARMGEDQSFVGMAVPQWVKSPGVGNARGEEEYFYSIDTGEAYPQPVSLMGAHPVDMDGDGRHEFAGGGKLISAAGLQLGDYSGIVALAGRFLPFPGEHLLTHSRDGVIRAYVDQYANDSAVALARYSHPFYRGNRKLTGCGYNKYNLSGV